MGQTQYQFSQYFPSKIQLSGRLLKREKLVFVGDKFLCCFSLIHLFRKIVDFCQKVLDTEDTVVIKRVESLLDLITRYDGYIGRSR